MSNEFCDGRVEDRLEPIRLTFFLRCPIGGESPLTPKATETEAI